MSDANTPSHPEQPVEPPPLGPLLVFAPPLAIVMVRDSLLLGVNSSHLIVADIAQGPSTDYLRAIGRPYRCKSALGVRDSMRPARPVLDHFRAGRHRPYLFGPSRFASAAEAVLELIEHVVITVHMHLTLAVEDHDDADALRAAGAGDGGDEVYLRAYTRRHHEQRRHWQALAGHLDWLRADVTTEAANIIGAQSGLTVAPPTPEGVAFDWSSSEAPAPDDPTETPTEQDQGWAEDRRLAEEWAKLQRGHRRPRYEWLAAWVCDRLAEFPALRDRAGQTGVTGKVIEAALDRHRKR